jgi:hypothetical protein
MSRKKLIDERYLTGNRSLIKPARKEEAKEVIAKIESNTPICKPEKPMFEK